jgi:hypothetical protein
MTVKTNRKEINQTPRGDRSPTGAKARLNSSTLELEPLIRRLYCGAKCGNAAAEHNLEKAGVIEMIQGHVAGQMREGDNFWGDLRWKLTELGRRTGMAKARIIILRDPPLEIALRDAMDEASDIADGCGGYQPDHPYVLMHRRILEHLLDRIERIRASGRS